MIRVIKTSRWLFSPEIIALSGPQTPEYLETPEISIKCTIGG
jgi:hypothetical protein